MDKPKWKKTCCNPFHQPNHSKKSNLRHVLSWMCEKQPNLTLDDKICDDCRKKLAKLPVLSAEVESTDSESQGWESQDVGESSQLEESALHQQESVESLNQCLSAIGETPITKKKLQQVKYPKEKLKKVKVSIKKKIFPDAASNGSDSESEMVKQLKEKFHGTTERSEKVQVLTVLPKSWSIRKVQDEFRASNYMVRTAKQLVKQKGILSSPNLKQGHSLTTEVVTLIQEFYESDEVSCTMPGKKDYVSVKQGETRIHIQKRLVLSNLKEVYHLFKEKYPTTTVGFSKFAELHPKQCVLAGASGTHSVCVCTIHQNVKLMMNGGKIPGITANDNNPLKTYDHCFAIHLNQLAT